MTAGVSEPDTRLLLVTGIPAAGKSGFARLLRDEHGYFAFVLEELSDVIRDEKEIKRLWLDAVNTGDASRLVRRLRNLPGPVVVEWGSPVNDPCLRCVKSMKDHGMRLLWFECPDDVARQRFVHRNTVPVGAFDVQTPNIRSNYGLILSTLQPEVIDVMDSLGAPKAVKEIAAEIGVT